MGSIVLYLLLISTLSCNVQGSTNTALSGMEYDSSVKSDIFSEDAKKSIFFEFGYGGYKINIPDSATTIESKDDYIKNFINLNYKFINNIIWTNLTLFQELKIVRNSGSWIDTGEYYLQDILDYGLLNLKHYDTMGNCLLFSLLLDSENNFIKYIFEKSNPVAQKEILSMAPEHPDKTKPVHPGFKTIAAILERKYPGLYKKITNPVCTKNGIERENLMNPKTLDDNEIQQTDIAKNILPDTTNNDLQANQSENNDIKPSNLDYKENLMTRETFDNETQQTNHSDNSIEDFQKKSKNHTKSLMIAVSFIGLIYFIGWYNKISIFRFFQI